MSLPREIVDEHTEEIHIHTEEAHRGLQFLADGEGRAVGAEPYREYDLAIKKAQVHAILAIGLRLDILILAAFTSNRDEVEVGGPA